MCAPEFVDCELLLTAPDQARLHALGREHSGRPQLDADVIAEIQATLDPLTHGSKLFAALLPAETDLLSGYREALAVARHAEKLLRLRFQVADTAPPALHRLRWELLHDPKKSVTWSCSREIAFSRCPAVPEPEGVAVDELPRLLVAIAEPADLAAYELPASGRDAAQAAVDEALAPLRGVMSWEALAGPVTAARLSERLRSGGIHALHLQAHGLLRDERASLVLEKEDGTADFVDEDTFADVFEGLRGSLRLVTLIACHGGAAPGESPLSGLGPGLIRRGVPAVVAMRQAVSFGAARRFVEHFYRHLAQTGIVDQSANEARHQLRLALRQDDEWSTPILSMRLAQGRLWTPRSVTSRVTPPRDETEINWQDVLDRIAEDNLVPVLGPGLCRGLLPSADEIAERWAADDDAFPLEGRTDLPTVAQFFATQSDAPPVYIQDRLLRHLKEDLLDRQKIEQRQRFRTADLSTVIDKIADPLFDHDPGEPHRALASLPLSTFITTNPDTFMAAALRFCNKRPHVEICRWHEDSGDIPDDYNRLRGSQGEPLVFHFYGNDSDASSLVLTEDHHLDFLYSIAGASNARFPDTLRAKLSHGMLLLLGYDLRRLDCRVLLRGVVNHLNLKKHRGRIAVLQIDPREADPRRVEKLRAYMASCCKDLEIKVVYRSVRDFLRELHEHWESSHGQRA